MSEHEPLHLTIDTNVFIHLLNPEKNEGSHIDHLLVHLLKHSPVLCEDTGGRIAAEYQQQLAHIISASEDIGIGRIILGHWLQSVARCTVDVKPAKQLAGIVKAIIVEETEGIDRTFVMVACLMNCPLITNDIKHIASRASTLRKKTKQYHSNGFAVYTTADARDHFVK